MSNVTITWYGNRVQKKFESILASQMEDAMDDLHSHVKKKISRGNRGGGNPSAPGEPPKVVDNILRSSISFDVQKNPIIGLVGSNVEYARYLALGTAVMEKRPYLRPSLFEMQKQILDTLTAA